MLLASLNPAAQVVPPKNRRRGAHRRRGALAQRSRGCGDLGGRAGRRRAPDRDPGHAVGVDRPRGHRLPDRRRAVGAYPPTSAWPSGRTCSPTPVRRPGWGRCPTRPDGLPHVPVRVHARSWHRYPEPSPEHRDGHVHLRHHRTAQRRADQPTGDRRRHRRPGAAWQWNTDDILVHGLPLFHVHGLVLGLLGSLRVGNRFVHTGKPTPEARRPPQARSTSGCRRCGRGWWPTRRRPSAASARLLVSGSAALPVPVFDRLAQLTGQQPVERYGSTESLITVGAGRR